MAFKRSPGGLPYKLRQLRQLPQPTNASSGSAAITEGPDTVAAQGPSFVAEAPVARKWLLLGTPRSRLRNTVQDTSLSAVASSFGVAAITEGADVAAGVGTDSVFGTAGIAEGADTAAAVGTDSVFGTAGITESADVVAGVGTDEVFGVAGIAEGVDTAAGVGTDSVSGSAGISEGADTAAAAGTDSVAGIAGITEGVDTAAAAGINSVAGIAGSVEDVDVANGAGTNNVTGTSGIVESADSIAGVGNPPGGGTNPSLIVKWTPFKLACRYRALRSGTLGTGNTQQNIANLLALATTEANSNSVWARWRTTVNSPHIPSNLMINVPLVPGFIPVGGFFGRMWDWIVKYMKGVA